MHGEFRALAIGALAFLLSGLLCAHAQPAAPPSNSAASEADRARAYFEQNNTAAALPLYEHLAAEDPANAGFAERLAFCLVSKLESLPTGPERRAIVERALKEAERARSLGDASPLLQMMLVSLAKPQAAAGSGNPMLDAAEAAFAKGDLDGALAGYQALAAMDPKSYVARLYAGDVLFRKHELALAGQWFQKAIDVDPDRETAYRYWGDALVQAGDKDAALARFVDGVVAEPYNQKAWLGLTQWANKNGASLRAPHVPVPQAPTPTDPSGAKPGLTIHVDASTIKDPKAAAAWLAYSLKRVQWRSEVFAKRFPGEKSYRHSLAEEAEALQMALGVLGEVKPAEPVDASLRDLVALGKAGMIEPYVLLNGADSGITADYPAYRAVHRQQLHEYVETFVVHRNSSVQ